ncbi:MAG TPA: glycosyltransferase family 1 protein [Mycobacteriales bacterium]|nr:glycosyltransferase family 1 protein [Mycobacteriales bacterium]
MSEPNAAIYIHRLIADPSGIQRYTVELANALHALGHPTTLVTGADEGTGSDVTADLRVLSGPPRRRHFAWTALRRPSFDRVVGGFDVVHMSSPAMTVPTKRPLVVTVHDLFPLEHPDWYDRVSRWGFLRGLDYAVDHASAFITPSDYVRGLVVDTLGVDAHRVTVIPEGVSGSLAVPAVRPEGAGRPYVVAVGALIARKNLDLLIDAMAQLPPGPATPQVRIVGDGPDRARLQARAAELADPDAVRLLGRVDDEELGRLFGGAIGLVHPALVEGFGLTTIEAMAAGLPVIASSSGALPEVVADAGVLVPPDDVAGWAASLSRLASDPDWREVLRRKGRERAAAYTWPKAAEATVAVYDGLRS